MLFKYQKALNEEKKTNLSDSLIFSTERLTACRLYFSDNIKAKLIAPPLSLHSSLPPPRANTLTITD